MILVRAFVLVQTMPQHPLIRHLIAVFLMFLSLWAPVCFAEEEPRSLESPGVVVLFDASLRSGAVDIVDLYPTVKRHLEDALGWPVTFKPTVLLMKRRETFQRVAGSSQVAAFAIPGKKLIVIDHSRMVNDPFRIEVTLRHELCHLLLHHYISHDKLPKWLDEGIAQWVSGGIGEFVMEQKASLLNEAVLTGRLIDIRNLSASFPKESGSFSLAYQESRSLVDYIVDKYGTEGILSLMRELQDHDIDRATKRGLSVSFEELEEAWRHHLRARLTWFTFLAHNVYEILFFVGGVIVILGFLRRLSKKRAYMQGEEDHFPDTRKGS